MSWVVLVLFSNVAFALGSLTSRLLMKDGEGDPVAYGFVSQLIVAILATIVAAATSTIDFSPLLPYIPLLVLMSITYALVNLFLYNSYQYADVATVNILLTTRAIWTVLFAVLFLGESITASVIAGTALVIAGIVVIFYRKGQNKFEFNKGTLFALATAFCFGAGFVIDAYVLQKTNIDPRSYTIVSFGLPAFTLLLFRPKSIKNVALFADPIRLRNIAFNGLFYGSSVLGIYFAYSISNNAAQIGPLGQTSVLFSIALAYIFLKERDNVVQKLLGSILVIAGALFLI